MEKREIRNLLNDNNIKYKSQFNIPVPKEINSSGIAYIDFYLPDYNLFVEYNGEQHYIPMRFAGGQIKFEKQQKRDEFVRQYCKTNNINLLEIPYTDKDYIDNLKQYLNICGM